MNTINDNIQEFLKKHKISTVCFSDNNKPHCINCFYTFDAAKAILIFKSSHGTAHDKFIKQGLCAAGTILANQIDITKLKGMQFSGTLLNEQQIHNYKLNLLYLKTFPLSFAMSGYLWGLQLEYIKFTDNSLGFGNKTIWQLTTENKMDN